MSIIGTDDQLTVGNWYVGNAHRIEEFQTSDGHALIARQVQALVEAMATFSPPPPGQTTLPADYRAALEPVLVANWQS